MKDADLALLGLQRGAGPAEVKRAYRRLARQLHPDLTGDHNKARFQELQAAYVRLTEMYDQPRSSAGPGKSDCSDPPKPSSGMRSAAENLLRDLGATAASKGAEHARVLVNETVRSKGKLARAAGAFVNVALEEGEAAITEALRTRK